MWWCVCGGCRCFVVCESGRVKSTAGCCQFCGSRSCPMAQEGWKVETQGRPAGERGGGGRWALVLKSARAKANSKQARSRQDGQASKHQATPATPTSNQNSKRVGNNGEERARGAGCTLSPFTWVDAWMDARVGCMDGWGTSRQVELGMRRGKVGCLQGLPLRRCPSLRILHQSSPSLSFLVLHVLAQCTDSANGCKHRRGD